jgi:hypothetical protein
MPGIITHKFRLNNAEQFLESFTEADNINTRYYMFLARAHGWTDDTSPPTPIDTILGSDFNIWRNMIAAKRVTSSDVTFAVARNNWTSGIQYTPYTDSNASLYTSNFFVVTDDFNVYKVIDNNNNALSTVKPSSTGTSIFTTSDGYRWKFMYNITPADVLKFTTTNFIPAKQLDSDDGSLQFDVQAAASNGAIDFIDVTSAGSGYLFATGTFSNVDSSTIVKLTSASTTDDSYVGSTVYVSGGTGSGQLREIVDYQGNINKATVNAAFSPVPDTSSTYIVGPKVTITGDGQGALAYANVALPALSSATVGNTVNQVVMIDTGSNYSKFNVTISANSSHGTGAVASGSVAPYGGHGNNAVKELGATDVILNVRMTGTESGTFITNNDFRIVGLMRDPLLANGDIANTTVYDMTTKLTVTGKSGTFSADEMIAGGTSGASARFVSFANTNASGTAGVISVTGLDGTFEAAETITGNTSTQTATVASINNRDLQDFKGDILYVENRLPVSRAADQTEDIKLIVRF